jgi:sterol desaturase/sphingolipid hydroxylase (fatty acid hydroxylase superfamily)
MPLDIAMFVVLPAGFLVAAIEGWILTSVRKRPYNWRGYLVSAFDSTVRQYLISPFFNLSLATPVLLWAWSHRIYTMPMTSPWSLLLLFVGYEFCYYWLHRTEHRVRGVWVTMHFVHHTPNEMNLSMSYRLGWTQRFFGAAMFNAPLVWIGLPIPAIFGMIAASFLYMFFIHNDWVGKLGWLEYVFNTPSHHRVHHASNPEYLDANFGGCLIIFDRLFGTFVEEKAAVPCRYGLVDPVSNNLFEVEFREWRRLWRDLRQAQSWGERILYVFGPPGWRPRRLTSPAAA